MTFYIRTTEGILEHRNESIKAYGNAVVPQVVLQIFKSIEQTRQ